MELDVEVLVVDDLVGGLVLGVGVDTLNIKVKDNKDTIISQNERMSRPSTEFQSRVAEPRPIAAARWADEAANTLNSRTAPKAVDCTGFRH